MPNEALYKKSEFQHRKNWNCGKFVEKWIEINEKSIYK
jgi:hypothetical protein